MSALSQDFATEVQKLVDCLGLRMKEEIYTPSNFGNGFITLEGDSLSVRLVRERGQVFVDVATKSGDWVYADEFLERHNLKPTPGTPLTAQQTIALLCTHAHEIRTLATQN